jgi:hypothetical protein
VKVTRIALSERLNPGKLVALQEQARRLGRVRSQVWQRYASIAGAGLRDRQVRDRWLADGTHHQFGVLANAWKETVRDAMADICANAASAKVEVKRAIRRHTSDPAEQKRLYTQLKADRCAHDAYLSRQMRQHRRRGHNRTHNQIVVRADKYNTRTDETGRLWLAVPGLVQRKLIHIPLNTTVAPTGTLRLILRNQRVEIHYQTDAATMKSSQYPSGTRTIGVDKGYTEVLTDSDGNRHGTRLGALLTTESDHRKAKGRARAKIRSIANNAAQHGDRVKADRIHRNNLGTIKRERRRARWQAQVRTETFTAVHRVVDQACTVVAEDLTKSFTGRNPLGKNTNRRLAAWTKGSPRKRSRMCRSAEVLRSCWSTPRTPSGSATRRPWPTRKGARWRLRRPRRRALHAARPLCSPLPQRWRAGSGAGTRRSASPCRAMGRRPGASWASATSPSAACAACKSSLSGWSATSYATR